MNRELFNYHIKKKGYTQDYVAEELGITRQSLNNRLIGAVPFTCNEAEKVGKYLKLSLADMNAIFFNEAFM